MEIWWLSRTFRQFCESDQRIFWERKSERFVAVCFNLHLKSATKLLCFGVFAPCVYITNGLTVSDVKMLIFFFFHAFFSFLRLFVFHLVLSYCFFLISELCYLLWIRNCCMHRKHVCTDFFFVDRCVFFSILIMSFFLTCAGAPQVAPLRLQNISQNLPIIQSELN